MNDERSIVALNDLRNAGSCEREVLRNLESNLEEQILGAVHSSYSLNVDSEFVKSALPTLLLTIAARYFMAMKDQVSNPLYADYFTAIASQSIHWVSDRSEPSTISFH